MRLLLSLILAATCFAWMYLYLHACETRNYRTAFFYKLFAGLCFLLIGLHVADGSRYAVLICFGLAFGLLGDELLALRNLRREQYERLLVLGGLAFAVGHVLYILAACVRHARFLPTLILFAVFLAASSVYLKTQRFQAGKLQNACYGYIGIVALMAAAALSSALNAGGKQFIMALGALLFLLSDNVLLALYFGDEDTKAASIVVHVSYYLAQLLIAASI